MHTFYIDALT